LTKALTNRHSGSSSTERSSAGDFRGMFLAGVYSRMRTRLAVASDTCV
jgi:trehalose/maltose hydrolase-like predicted phosphorylase